MTVIDETIFLWINGLTGNISIIDWIVSRLANDYFIIMGSCLVLLALWYIGGSIDKREENQKAVIGAAISLGITQGFVALCNIIAFRPRPFTQLTTNLLFYAPTDSSFPSNAVSIVFAIAVSIILVNRRAGGILLLLAFLFGFSRIFVGIHYPSDILGGAIIAALVAFLVFRILKLMNPLISLMLNITRKFYIA